MISLLMGVSLICSLLWFIEICWFAVFFFNEANRFQFLDLFIYN
jgi:hypothetical protein